MLNPDFGDHSEFGSVVQNLGDVMLPYEEALEVREALMGYIVSQYPLSDPAVMKEFQSFLRDPEKGLSRGPFVAASLPFKATDPAETAALSDYLAVRPKFTPYNHQMQAFKRLATWDYLKNTPRIPEPVIMTTGTGSGKTESFLFPVLDYCLRMNQGQGKSKTGSKVAGNDNSAGQSCRKPGVKVIIMYPMNALATDQAKRLAQEISRLPLGSDGKPLVTAGLLIGQPQPEKTPQKGSPGGKSAPRQVSRKRLRLPTAMGPDHIIEDRETIIREAPDIILTNFKMLDRALMLEEFHNLWTGNIPDPEEVRSGREFHSCLRFIVLDEIHTYDGAQGSDVANLLRRLRLKLRLEPGELCPVGTSATIGGSSIAEYASKIFGENITDDAVIGETRLSLNEFLREGKEIAGGLPDIAQVMREDLSLRAVQDLSASGIVFPEEIYLDRVSRVWFPAYEKEFPLPLEDLSESIAAKRKEKARQNPAATKDPSGAEAQSQLSLTDRLDISRDIVSRRIFRGRCLRGLQNQKAFRDIISAVTLGNIPDKALLSYVENDAEFEKLFNDFTASGSLTGTLSLAEEDSGSPAEDKSPAENGITARAREEAATRILRQLLDLISGSDAEDSTADFQKPFLYIRITMWARELTSLARVIDRNPAFVFTKQSRRPELNALALPMWSCRKCGGSGWVALLNQIGRSYEHSLSAIGQAFMRDSPDIRLLAPRNDPEDAELRARLPDAGEQQSDTSYRMPVISGEALKKRGLMRKIRLSPDNLDIEDDTGTGSLSDSVTDIEERLRQVPAYEYRFVEVKNGQSAKFREVCPFCLASSSISLTGGHVSYLSSVAMNAVMSSETSGQKADERRLLVFSNAVQNAAFLAGVYEDRSFRFAFRHAMTEYFRYWKGKNSADLKSSGITLRDYVSGFVSYFTDKLGHGDPLSRDFIAFFRPSQEMMYFRYEDYWHNADSSGETAGDKANQETSAVSDSKRQEFLTAFQNRMIWECVNEFAEASDDGRSLMVTGTLAAGFDPEKLRKAQELVRNYLNNSAGYDFAKISPEKLSINPGDTPETVHEKEERLYGFISSFLHCLRERGAIETPYTGGYRGKALHELSWFSLKPAGDFRELTPVFNVFNIPRLTGVMSEDSKGRDAKDAFKIVENIKISDTGRSRYFEMFARAFLDRAVTFADEEGIVRKFYEKLFQALEESGLLMRLNPDAAGRDIGDLYYIPLDAVRISDELVSLECPACGHRFQALRNAPGRDYHICPVMIQHSFQMLERDPLRDHCLDCHQEPEFGQDQGNRYYRDLYSTRSSPRITAREHTGILTRSLREETEQAFRKGSRGEIVNVLSATATLEMGIDIGDLNTLILAGLPENTASYLQRTGRAGRKEGNSLVLNFARAGSRYDLYYFDRPLDLMQGRVTTPGCFLESFDIIRRHFLAYCFDSALTDSFVTGNKTVCIRNTVFKESAIPEFVDAIEKYVAARREDLLSRFASAYQPFEKRDIPGIPGTLREIFGEEGAKSQKAEDDKDASWKDADRRQELFQELERFVKSGEIFQNLRGEFIRLADIIRDLYEQRSSYHEILDQIPEADKHGRREYRERLRMVNIRLNKLLNDQRPLEFMVDQGQLPNYAFPEKGVSFTGQIMDFSGPADENNDKSEKDDKSGKNKKKSAQSARLRSEIVELTEPANVALTALAPDNTFYSNGHRFVVMGADPASLGNRGAPGTAGRTESVRSSSPSKNSGSGLVRYYYCGKCDGLFMEVNKQYCPKCGSSGLKQHFFMQMPAMLSEMTRKTASLLNNAREERDFSSYITQNHFSFESRKGPAYVIREIPFAVEFCDKVKITAVNYGNDRESDRESPTVNGRKVKKHGFVVCTSCGKITSLRDYYEQHRGDAHESSLRYSREQSRSQVKPEDPHFRFCRYQKLTSLSDEIPGTGQRLFAETWLMREFSTEALRILLPSYHNLSSGNGNSGTEKGEMIRAVLRQGIKSYYGGSPDHLDFVFYNEYNPRTANFDEYLVIYDRVPGGTGYLKKLMEKSGDQENRLVFQDVFQAGYQAISACPCRSDGCYNCVNFYGQDRNQLKKSRTVKYVESLLKQTESVMQGFQECHDDLASLRQGEEPDESMLEGEFLELLEKYAGRCEDTFRALDDEDGSGWLWQGSRTEDLPDRKKRMLKFAYRIIPEADICSQEARRIPYTVPDYLFELRSYEEWLYEESGPGKMVQKYDARNDGRDDDAENSFAPAKILLYLDGYRYHGCSISGEEPRFFRDLEIREELRRGNTGRKNQYITWTLTWDDIVKYQKNEETGEYSELIGSSDSIYDDYSKGEGNLPKTISAMLKEYLAAARELKKSHPLFSRDKVSSAKESGGKDALNQLIFILLHPHPDYLRKVFFGFTAAALIDNPRDAVLADSLLNLPFTENYKDLSEAKATLVREMKAGKKDAVMYLAGRDPFELPGRASLEKSGKIPRIYFSLDNKSELRGSVHFRMSRPGYQVTADGTESPDLDKQEWQHFWHAYNLLALLPHYAEITRQEDLIRMPRDLQAPVQAAPASSGSVPEQTFGKVSDVPEMAEKPDEVGYEEELKDLKLPEGFERKTKVFSEKELRIYPGISEAMKLLGGSGLLGADFSYGDDCYDGDDNFAAFISDPLKLAVEPGEDCDLYFVKKGYLIVLGNDDAAGYERVKEAGGKAVFSKDFRLSDIPGCQKQ